MKTRVTLETNTGFRVERNELQGDVAVAVAFTKKNENLTEARLAAIGPLDKEFVRNFGVASVSVLEKAIQDHPEESAAFAKTFAKAICQQIKKLGLESEASGGLADGLKEQEVSKRGQKAIRKAAGVLAKGGRNT